MNSIKLYDTVALLESITTEQFMTDHSITLPQGQVGTVVEEYKKRLSFLYKVNKGLK